MTFDAEQTLARALDLHKAGRSAEAAPLYRQILAVNPKHVDSLHLLGVAAYDAGRNHEAFNLISKAIVLNDRVADFHCNMGLVLQSLGRPDEAVAHYRQAIAIDRRHALTYNNLGNLLTDMGKTEDAVAQLRQALEINPQYTQAHYNLANALAKQGRLNDAVTHYRHAVSLAPNFIDAQNNLGTALDEQGKIDEAAAQYRRVLAIDPQNARAHYNLGNVFRAKGDYEAAVSRYKQALARAPDFADAWNNLGALLAERGDLNAGREAYEKAVEAGPTRAAYHRNLANSKRFKPGDAQLAQMEQLIRNIALVPEAERIDLQFALGKAYADLKEYDRSFHHLLAGNTLKRARFVYDEAEALSYIRRIRTVFGAQLLEERDGGGDPAETPVFVVGMPRSGTTLVEQIIASHPRAMGAGELFDLDRIVHSLAGPGGSAPGYPEAVETMSGKELRLVGERYLAAIRALAPLSLRVVDKMPWNFHHLGLVRLALPNARIIHTQRNPADTCLSCFSILFNGDDNKYTYDLRELGRFYRAYDALMAHWRAVLPPGFMLEVQYEAVVEDLENQARRIISHCGLDWDDACLAFHETRRPVRTSSVAQVRQPIYRSSVGRWLPYREWLRPLLDELGIDPEKQPIQPASFHAGLVRGSEAVESGPLRDSAPDLRTDPDIGQTFDSALALHQAGRFADAAELCRQILAIDPNHADSLHLLGVLLHHLGRNEEALELIHNAIALNGQVADFHCNLGLVLLALGHASEAETHYRRALGIDPDHAETCNNLGTMHADRGMPAEAEVHFRHAIAARPGYAEAHYNLANVLRRLDQTGEAIAHYQTAISLRPGFANAHYNLGHALTDQRQFAEAEECYRQAVSLVPDRADFQNNLGVTLHELYRLDEAEACYRRALAICPDHPTALDNLAALLRSTCRTAEAIACLRRAMEISPDNAVFHTDLIFALNFIGTATAAEHQAERKRWDAQHARRSAQFHRPHANLPDPQRRLRIGYVSSHFCHQAATFAFAGVILNHDREQFEVICYSDTPREDEITGRLRAGADHWRHTAKLSDDALAELIRSDGVDILVDLVGHMGGHRLLVFARKPAPVQVTAWGEPTGTGLKSMDYLLADPVLVPEGVRDLLAERVVDLPNFLGFWTSEPLPPIGPPPALTRGYVTFGSFNRPDKILPAVVQIWGKILVAIPTARILLKNPLLADSSQRDRIITLFRENGVVPERLELRASSSRFDHFSTYQEVDLALDPFPHGGGMTTLDALWMGVPTVTSPGGTISSRLAAASLTAAGLNDFIAPDLRGYVDLAIAKAADLPALARLRAHLRRHMERTAFGDPVRYARAVETAYRDIWRRWCAAQAS